MRFSTRKITIFSTIIFHIILTRCADKQNRPSNCNIPIGHLLFSEEWLELGTVQMNKVQEKWVHIFNPTRENVTLSVVETPEENSSLKVSRKVRNKRVQAIQSFTIPSGKVDSLLVTFLPQNDFPYGEFLNTVYLKCNGEILMTGIKVGGIVVDDFENVPPSETPRGILDRGTIVFRFEQGKQIPVTFDVEVQNNGNSDLIVRKIETTCSCVTTKLDNTTIATGKSTVLHAQFIPEGLAGSFWQEIRLVTNDPQTPLKTVFIRCYVEEKN